MQSSFATPCVPLQNSQPGASQLFSGFMPVAAGAAMMPVFTVMINDTKPIWYYCSQASPKSHCQAGMVGVINPPAADPSKNIGAFMSLAMGAPQTTSTGQVDTGSMPSTIVTAPAAATSAFTSAYSAASSFSTDSAATSFSTGTTTTVGAANSTSSIPLSTGAASSGRYAGSRELYSGMVLAALAGLMSFAL